MYEADKRSRKAAGRKSEEELERRREEREQRRDAEEWEKEQANQERARSYEKRAEEMQRRLNEMRQAEEKTRKANEELEKQRDAALMEKEKLKKELAKATTYISYLEDIAISRWCANFIKRFDRHGLNIAGKTSSADKPAAEKFVGEELTALLEEGGYEVEDVYNFDEAGLAFKTLPTRTYALPSERAAKGARVKKDRITIGVCANATGTHRLPLLVNGRARHPQLHGDRPAPRRLHPLQEGVDERSAVRQEAVTEKQMREGRVGLVDTTSSHALNERVPSSVRLTTKFLPPNTASLIQPMDQGVIAKTNRGSYLRCMAMRYLAFSGDFEEFYLRMMFLKQKSGMIMEQGGTYSVLTESQRNLLKLPEKCPVPGRPKGKRAPRKKTSPTMEEEIDEPTAGKDSALCNFCKGPVVMFTVRLSQYNY
ncbi:hypothetical protein FOCC_FOCC014182 [Frankliniella occidentalis]|nr:hypothetical protein FOCC_FOCC014182 [Frankliniella occidentalis]